VIYIYQYLETTLEEVVWLYNLINKKQHILCVQTYIKDDTLCASIQVFVYESSANIVIQYIVR
jgi:hypothetical protein